MPDSVDRNTLDASPTADHIADYRERANSEEKTIEVAFPAGEDTKRLVVSPRGTIVLLNNVSEETFNRSVSAEEVAAALPE